MFALNVDKYEDEYDFEINSKLFSFSFEDYMLENYEELEDGGVKFDNTREYKGLYFKSSRKNKLIYHSPTETGFVDFTIKGVDIDSLKKL